MFKSSKILYQNKLSDSANDYSQLFNITNIQNKITIDSV